MQRSTTTGSLLFLLLLGGPLCAQEAQPAADSGGATNYSQRVLADEPIAYWNFDGASPLVSRASLPRSEAELALTPAGKIELAVPGPRPGRFPLFTKENAAVAIAPGRYLRAEDPGDASPLDFDVGDSITLEAWVNLAELGDNQNVYVFGKGRTGRDGFARENQNYALRLRGIDGTARVSFLFRNAKNGTESEADYHRWNSEVGFAPDSGWHHVAVTYTFGQPSSIRGYLDGQPVDGSWDMAGPTSAGPVVDNDQLWIGSALGGSAGNTLHGEIDEVAIYRTALSADRLRDRYQADPKEPQVPDVAPPQPPAGEVLVEIFEGVSGNLFRPGSPPVATFTTSAMLLGALPHKYNAKGLITDWKQPLLVRVSAHVEIPAGDYELLLRAKDSTRLFVDGKLLAQTSALRGSGSGHERVPDLKPGDDPRMRWPAGGHQERRTKVSLASAKHLVMVQTVVGSSNVRPEIGEMCVALSRGGEFFRIVSPERELPLSDADIEPALAAQSAEIVAINRQLRNVAGQGENNYWAKRHELARAEVAKLPAIEVPPAPKGYETRGAIDQFIAAELAKENLAAGPPADDWQFLRRVYLDTVGVVPTPTEIAAFAADKDPRRREKLIDKLLSDPRWADHWTGYWQDVLAENPNILKGNLNNTGPFRWWIYESLADNKPLDRFASELVMMEGSTWYGGPAGFAVATENDAPMAAKAHIIAKAMLGVEMQCARCHDAPYHEVKQADVFSIAALLGRGSQKIPKTSVVPVVAGARKPAVEISLTPGQVIKPDWPFRELTSEELPDGLLRDEQDQRERLAAIITSPRDDRFAQVMANRVWARYLGRGFVNPVDDWEGVEPSHPQLLAYLSRELVTHDYDLKHLARLILNSHAYQRQLKGDASPTELRLFASPTRRRLSAEQVVDSLYLVAGKDFGSEPLSVDPEGRRPVTEQMNLGIPGRAWQFTSLSNERDRPALAMPVAQSIMDVLTTFGWRESRPDPITEREKEPTLLQPAVVANGIVGRRIVRLSDDSALTRLALEAKDVTALVEATFLRVLSRPPTDADQALFGEFLETGFAERQQEVTQVEDRPRPPRHAVSWSNHLSPEATQIKLQLEELVRAGDPPTSRLSADWREHMEDTVWALVNSPEFMFVP